MQYQQMENQATIELKGENKSINIPSDSHLMISMVYYVI